ncbi:MAG: ABC transporter permease [Spirochaetaceae bacterium]|jgi:lipoprotein-releasing system permease protein|nr:ABC transporter permease [Spirochaetaceae bacterium]
MGWIGFIAGRLVARKRGAPAPVLSILGIAVGVLALTVIIAVMNGFQLSFIESILEISSYYVRIENLSSEKNNGALTGKVKNLPGVNAAVPFRELQALVRGVYGQQAALIRGLQNSAAVEDLRMAEKLVFEEGSFELEAKDSILLGAELAARLQVGLGDTIQLISIGGPLADLTAPAGAARAPAEGMAGEEPETDAVFQEIFFTVRGIFRSGFYEYDLGWGFINFDRAGELEGPGYNLGLKLQDRWQDRRAAAAIAELAGGDPSAATIRIRTWRDFNQAFFGALRTEKLFMFVLVGLIFVVVGLNIYQAQRRVVLERREEIGLLRALGAGDRAVRLIFVWDGFIIGIAGAGIGISLGLLISLNISTFFSVLERAVNGILFLIRHEGNFAVFSPAVFYVKEIQGRVIPHEALLIFLFGLLSALGAAWFASGRISRIRPAEVLRYE